MALAPERTGIGIRRYFTTPGVDPYDTVTWERRDARITNWATGAVAFEQLGVEVPSTWSVNATNILAQKYFRGTLGTDEREWSLKQVADRVVGSILAWGLKDGYFADKEEAAAFSDELKWLIIHQRAAFNSPVWFNIGVEGVPQQASACQPYGALVTTPYGLVPIGKLVESEAVGAKVYDAHGVTRVVAVKANGRKPVLRLHTKAGHALDVTADHLVWRRSGVGTGRFVPAGSVNPGDQLTWHRTQSFGSGEISSREMAEAALAGWLQSDGFVGQYPTGTNRSLTIEAMTVTGAELAWVTGCLDKLFPDIQRRESKVVTESPELDCRRTRLYGEGLRAFVERWGLLTRGQAMTVPEQLFEAPLPVVQCYLRSLFQAEGYVSLRPAGSVVAFDMISERIVRGAQKLLARFGIFSRVRFKHDRQSDRKGCWSLSVRSEGDRRLFAAEIGFIDPVKTAKLEKSFEVQGKPAFDTKALEVARVEELGEMDVYDIQTESGEYLSDGLRVHNCFILSVDDHMDSILNWYVEEGTIFKGGSGAGINLSRIRSSKEGLRGGGTASGPVSFMRGADASAGTIKSGGKTRRAAKMVILDAGHPDIEDFIWCKAVEERKARALRDAGFDMDLDGKDSHSIQYQNANNSVRVSDDFMQAVLDDKDWELKAISTGEVLQSMKARDLFRQIAKAAWECADPGMQFDTTINRWHTSKNTGRINASNPCFTGDSLVHTDKGLISFTDLFARANQGETFGVYTHDATNPDAPSERVELTSPEAFMITGYNEVVKLHFDNGMEVRCTPSHRLFTTNRGYVQAKELTPQDTVKVLDLPAPPVSAGYELPISTDVEVYATGSEHVRLVNLPEKWDPELAHYLGWVTGSSSVVSNGTVGAVYDGPEAQSEVLPRHEKFVSWLNGGIALQAGPQLNGSLQERLSRPALTGFFAALGLTSKRGLDKRVPWSVLGAPTDIVSSFLRGLFDADGTVRRNDGNSSYVALGSGSRSLLVDAQRLLATFGIASAIWRTAPGVERGASRAGNDVPSFDDGAHFELRVGGESVRRFARVIGFDLSSKTEKLSELLNSLGGSLEADDGCTNLVSRTENGFELTYNLSEPRNHSYIVNGLVVANCSEYMHLDNSACNLASINLLTYLDSEGNFDVDGFKASVDVLFTAQEILVGNADYPTKPIGETSRRFRQLGLGYANLGALLMAQGLPYDSDAGRAWAGAITALMTGHAYAVSARTAARMGPFAGFHENREPMLEVLRMHRAEVAKIDEDMVPPEILSAAQEAWDTAVETGEKYGVRNSQSTVLAPTGTIGLLMDCDTTGIEPDLGLVKTKKLVGGGTMSIVNQTVPRALRRLGYSDQEVGDIVSYIDEHKSILGAPHLSPDHLAVFACSMGDNTIHYRGHIKMMAAAQPFISGAISKTVNVPEDVTVEDVEQLHIEAWQLGIKAIAMYRDNCKVAQPLATTKKAIDATTPANASEPELHDAELAKKVADLEQALQLQTVIVKKPIHEHMPRKRKSSTFSFRVADCEGYVTVGEFPDGRPGEVFISVSKQGSTLAGIMDAFAISVSMGLQHGVPLATFVRHFTNMRFEPAGMTDDPDLRFASSLVDYIFRRLAVEYMTAADRIELGIMTVSERMQPTLPGVEEATVVDEPIQPSAIEEVELRDNPKAPEAAKAATRPPSADNVKNAQAAASDAPMCYTCGVRMQRAGSCFACPSCGSTSGCS